MPVRVIAGLLSVLLTVWLPYEAVFDERRLMMWDRVDAVAGAVVRRQLDWPWYMLEAVVFVGVLWLLNADKSGFPFWVGRVFRYGIVVWCVFVVAGSLLGWRMVRVRQRMWPTWRYWYRNGVIASFVVACVCIAMMCWAFFRGFGVPVLVEIRYEPAPGVSSVTYSVHARDWQAKRTVDAGSTVVLRGEAVRNMRVNRFYSKGPWLTFTLNVYDNNGFLRNYATRYMQVVVLPVPARSQGVCVVLGKRFVGACGSATVGGAAAECVAGIVRSSVAPQCDCCFGAGVSVGVLR